MIHDDELGKILASEALQLNEDLQKDPLLGSIEQMWNVNPFREVIPVDWAGIAASLRIVWLRSMREPGTAMTALAKLNAALWRTAFDVWSDAGNRWLGMAPADVRFSPARRQAVCGPGMANQPGLPHAQGELSSRLRLAAAGERPSRGYGRSGEATHQLSSTPIRRCDEPIPVADLEPRGAETRHGDRRRPAWPKARAIWRGT